MITIKKGLDLPIAGEPAQKIFDAPPVRSVALVGFDYIGMKPTMQVQVGDKVKKGQVLFADKKNPGVLFTAPGAGEVVAINRGEKRVLQSVVIELKGEEEITFASYSDEELANLSREKLVENLVASGLWTAFRTRPFSKSPAVDSTPASIFVTAIDTNPLAAKPEVFLKEYKQDFIRGLSLLTKLTSGKVFLCKAEDAPIPGRGTPGVTTEEFSGPHPAGLPGTHIHFLDPVHAHKSVWSINYQDVVAIAKLMSTGKLFVERFVALGGPQAAAPRILRTRLGASITDLTKNEGLDGENRVISGSVLNGRAAKGPMAYLGRFHLQVSLLKEGKQREFLGWLAPGFDKFSIKNIFASKLFQGQKFAFDTNCGGSRRAMVPVGSYESVMPLDIEPVFLLRSLIIKDTDQAQALGALELDEEDLALCSFVCPGKYEYGDILRENLTIIEKEG